MRSLFVGLGGDAVDKLKDWDGWGMHFVFIQHGMEHLGFAFLEGIFCIC